MQHFYIWSYLSIHMIFSVHCKPFNMMRSVPKLFIKAGSLFAGCFLFCGPLLAHNGKVAYAYPLRAIKVDGDWS